jgi:hypothetical protein
MKKRLCKKLHRAEFRKMAFPIDFRLVPGIDERTSDAFLDQLIDVVEAQGLGFSSGGRETWSGVVTKLGRGSATEEDRSYIDTWLREHPQIAGHSVGPRKDAWYGDW